MLPFGTSGCAQLLITCFSSMVLVAEALDERLDAESVNSEPTNEIDHIDHDPEFGLILHVLGGNLSELLLRKLSPDTEGILLHNFEERGSSERLASVGILAIGLFAAQPRDGAAGS